MAVSPVGHELIGSGSRHVLVLHGWFGDHSIWEAAYPLLDRNAFTYAFMDCRGFGLSREIEGDYTMQEIADDSVALVNHLGWERFAVVGHSMGGKAAQRLAIDASERVTAVVGVTPVPASGIPLPPEMLNVFAAVPFDDAAARGVIEGSLGGRADRHGMVEQILQLQRRTTDPLAAADYLSAFAQTNFSDEAHGLTQPFLVLAGEHDGGLSEAFVRATFPVLYPQAEIAVLPDAGHYPMVEIPGYLVAIIEHFLREHA
ncbi:alpha/beta fold hydrolase [Paraburkholderia sediminicola]|uniref:alpha/beta fold hydrolase n=1 Tax=Paraburkholderia sediminicola TaxID=458836 RepID=UPI0038BAB030